MNHRAFETGPPVAPPPRPAGAGRSPAPSRPRHPRTIAGRLAPLVFAVLALLSAGAAAAQEVQPPAAESAAGRAAGAIAGTAFDADGHRAGEGEALLIDLRRRAALDAEGRFRFDGVPPGEYLVQVQSPTLGGGVRRVIVAAGETAEVEIALDRSMLSDELFVTAGPDPRSQLEVAQPTSVLSGEDLDLRRQATLGETLAEEPGVSSTYFGPGASRPVIRGLGGDRVRVLSDGVGSADASSASPDHAVSVDPLSAQRIEVLRGPATLLYGSSAVGGVVNVLDGRIPDYVPAAVTGQVEIAGGSVAEERSGAVSLDGGGGRLAWHVDYLARETDDYEIPGRAELEAEHEIQPSNVLPNSALESEAGAFGLSWIGDDSYVGVSLSGYDTLYGVPGAHHHEEEGEEHEGEAVRIDLEQRRFDLRGEHGGAAGLRGLGGLFRGVKYRLGVTDYEHAELEGTEVGTRFTNESWEGRLELVQERRGILTGSIGAQLASSDFAAAGAEAFVPPSVTDSWALFAFEELALSERVRLQLGGRLERQEIDPESDDAGRADDGLSGSAGLVWDPSEGYSVGLSAARSERLPAATELYADGPHAATRAFEIGDPGLDTETSLGVDLSLRKREGRLTGVLNLFANRFDGYVFEDFTGEEEDGLPVVRFEQEDAEFYGAELDAVARVAQIGEAHLDLRFGADLVRSELTATGEPLPRIPPVSGHLGLDFHHGPLRAMAEAIRAEEQDQTAENETPTAGYTLVNASVSYRLFLGRTVTDLILRGRNLGDEEARNHVSFLKDVAPLPGRDVSLALRLGF